MTDKVKLDDWAQRKERRMEKEFQALRKKMRGKGKTMLTTQVLSVIDALTDPRFGDGTLELLAIIKSSAFGDRHRTCFICDKPFGPRTPAARNHGNGISGAGGWLAGWHLPALHRRHRRAVRGT